MAVAKIGASNPDMGKRKEVDSLIGAECESTGTSISIEENRRAIAVSVIGALDRPKQQRKVDEEGHAVTTATVGGTALFHGKIDSSFRRTFTADDKLHFWDRFKKKKNWRSKDQARFLALEGGDKCDWATLVLESRERNQQSMVTIVLSARSQDRI
jgi:hypothetical protein